MKSFILILLVLFPILMGFVTYFVGKKFNKVREILAISTSVIELILMGYVMFTYPLTNQFLSFTFKADTFRSIHGLITVFMWMATLMLSKQYMEHYENKDRYYLFYLLTLGATIGVFFSDSLWTTFMFFEMMSLTSFVLVLHDEKKESISGAMSYLAFGIISGMILLMGMFLLNGEVHTLNFDEIFIACQNGISTKTFIAGILLLIGFGAKAGMFPLHTWLPKTYTVAPAPATALLSGILSKTGVFGIIICAGYIFASVKSFAIILFVLALITMSLGAILAVFSTNFKRTLACSSMSQIGFILSGLAMLVFLNDEARFAINGSFMHMANHSLIKLVLFMVAGIIFMNIYDLDINKMQGYGRKKYVLMVCFALGCLSVMCIPGFSGYFSKTLLHEAIVEYGHHLSGTALGLLKAGEYVFLFSGGLTIAYMLKLFVCVFIEKNNDASLQEKYDNQKSMKPLTTVALIVSTIVMCAIPYILNLQGAESFFNVKLDEHIHELHYFSWECLKGAVISLCVGLAVYFGFIRTVLLKKKESNKQYVNIWPNWLDIEKLIYRPFLFVWTTTAFKAIFRFFAELFDICVYLVRRYILRQYRYQFEGTPMYYRFGLLVSYFKKGRFSKTSAYKFYEKHVIAKDVKDTLNATFSFDFLMACIGVVVILLIALI